jgi:SET domain-containing protein
MNKYGMRFKGMNLLIDVSRKETLAKYMNHSCIPNCINEMWGIKGMPQSCLFANMTIKSGEELTFNYDWELPVTDKVDLRRRGTKCLCKAKKCFGKLKRGLYQ